MSGRNKTAERQAEQVTAAQLSMAREQNRNAQEDRTWSRDLMKPAIDFNKALVSGDQGAREAAMSPVVQAITQNYKQSRETIAEGMPSGAAKDFALMGLDQQRGAHIGQNAVNLFLSAQDKLANIGAGLGSFSLNETGASLRGFEGAGQSAVAQQQVAAQRKAATMGFIGSLAQTAGSVAAGGLTAPKAPTPAGAAPTGLVNQTFGSY